jgi:hypothetical protein
MVELLKLAERLGKSKKLQTVSLGQGQGVSKGAPTAKDFKDSAKTAKKGK